MYLTMFIPRVFQLLQASGYHNPNNLFPDEMVEAWRQFVDWCTDGYHMNIYEYENDLSIRRRIELVLSAESLKGYPEYRAFAESVYAIDADFKKLLNEQSFIEGREQWWHKGILKEAGTEYAEDVKSLFGVVVGIK